MLSYVALNTDGFIASLILSRKLCLWEKTAKTRKKSRFEQVTILAHKRVTSNGRALFYCMKDIIGTSMLVTYIFGMTYYWFGLYYVSKKFFSPENTHPFMVLQPNKCCGVKGVHIKIQRAKIKHYDLQHFLVLRGHKLFVICT